MKDAFYAVLFIVAFFGIQVALADKEVQPVPQDESTWRCVESDARTHTCTMLRKAKGDKNGLLR